MLQSPSPSDHLCSLHTLFLLRYRYGRDYYINDAKNASGSRRLRTSGDLRRIRTDLDVAGPHADLYTDDGDDDSVSDLELFSNRNRRGRSARVTKYSTLNSHTAKAQLMALNGDGRMTNGKRSMSVCSLSSGGSSLDSQAWSLADDDDLKNVALIERFALHNDIRRSSFRSRNGTSNFVMNPLFRDEDYAGGRANESHT